MVEKDGSEGPQRQKLHNNSFMMDIIIIITKKRFTLAQDNIELMVASDRRLEIYRLNQG
jgi:hypothetical protein